METRQPIIKLAIRRSARRGQRDEEVTVTHVYQGEAPETASSEGIKRVDRLCSALGSYARLAKLDVFDLYLSSLVVWTLLAPDQRFAVTALLPLSVYLLGTVCVVGGTCAFDDVTGYRDGSDAVNYGTDARLRRLHRKPLLTGALTPDQALRFARGMALAGTLLWSLTVVIAPHRAPWAVLILGLTLFAALQYSWGLRLSYHRMQEAVLWFCGMGMVLAPYGLLSSSAVGFPLVQAIIFGWGPMLFGLYANTNDIPGDARAGRRTVAVTVSPRANKLFIGLASAAETAIVLTASATGIAPRWFVLVMLPVIAMRCFQMVIGLHRGSVLAARRLGIRIHRTTVVLLALVNIVRLQGA
jgi:1,4-dihydroxy-2-naphthoate octaprenyltransferase